MTRQKVILDLEEPDVLFAAPDQARDNHFVESKRHELKVAKLPRQKFDLLEAHEILERVH